MTRARLALTLVLALLLASCGGGGEDTAGPDLPTGPEDTYPYPVGKIVFRHLPVDPDRVDHFMGLGWLNVLPEDHGGFVTPRDGWYKPPTIPVYALADGTIKGLIVDSIPGLGRDLTMRIKYSTTITTTYAHMSEFAPEIWAAAGDLARGYGVDNPVTIPVRAGQVVGYIGTQGALDFYIGDQELRLHFINPSRYPDPMLASGYYFDYFAEPQVSRLKAITIRQVEPRAGKIDYDVPGKIIGNWFLEGTTRFEQWSNQLAIVYDVIYGDRIAISDGSVLGEGASASAVYGVEGNAPRPETVGVGDGLIKYEIRQISAYIAEPGPEILGTFLVEMPEAGKLRVEKVLGKRASQVSGFSGSARLYIR